MEVFKVRRKPLDVREYLLTRSSQSWYVHNLQISIPVTVVVGIVVLLILCGILRCKCTCGLSLHPDTHETPYRSLPVVSLQDTESRADPQLSRNWTDRL